MNTNPMPIELVLAAHDYKMPCLMSLAHGCPEMSAFLLHFAHEGDGSQMCGTPVVPLCDSHTAAATWATSGGALADLLGAEPLPPCDACGRGTMITKVTTLRGEPA